MMTKLKCKGMVIAFSVLFSVSVVFMFISLVSAEDLPGLKVPGKLTTGDTSLDWALFDSNLGQGGYHQVSDLVARRATPPLTADSLTGKRRSPGMLVYVRSEGKTYRLKNNWDPTKVGDPTDDTNWEEVSAEVSGGTGGTITDGTITDDDISADAAIDSSKISGLNATNWDTAYSERRQWDGSPNNLDVILGKTSLGLENVDNTSDANKPISTAQQLAFNSLQAGLDLKAPIESPVFTGTVETAGFKLTTAPGEGKVLTSDASGLASWADVTYTNVNPTPEIIGGIPAGTDFETPTTMQEMWTALLYPYQAPAFTAFSSDPNIFTIFEVGQSLPLSTILRYTVSNPGNIGAQPAGELSTDVSNATFTNLNLPSPYEFELAESGTIPINIPEDTTLNEPGTMSVTIEGTNSEGDTFTASGTITWKYKRYSGMFIRPDEPDPLNPLPLTDAEIRGLTNQEFADSRVQTRTMSPSGEYIYIVYPAAWGTATFVVGGLTVDWILSVQDHTNASGHIASYNVYRSPSPLTGDNYNVQVN